VAKRKNEPVRWYALAAVGRLEKPERAEATFDRLMRLVRQEPALVALWDEEQVEAALFRARQISRRHWSSAYDLSRTENPLIVLGKQLPRDILGQRLANALVSPQVYMRVLALQLLARVYQTLAAKRVDEWMEQALDDRDKRVRREALQVAQTLVKREPRPKVVAVVAERLTDDDRDIRETGWELFESVCLQG
jgi:hypothetical protein